MVHSRRCVERWRQGRSAQARRGRCADFLCLGTPRSAGLRIRLGRDAARRCSLQAPERVFVLCISSTEQSAGLGRSARLSHVSFMRSHYVLRL